MTASDKQQPRASVRGSAQDEVLPQPRPRGLFGIPALSRRGLMLLVLIAGFIALAAALVSGGLNAQKRRAESQALYAHTLEVMAAGREAMSTIQDLETGQRGFLLARDEIYLEPYTRANAAIDGQIAKLKQLTIDNPEQQRFVDELNNQVAGLRISLGQGIEAARAGRFEEALASYRSDMSKRLMDNIRSTMQSIIVAEEALLGTRRETSRTTSRALSWYLLGLAALGILLIVFAVAGSFSALHASARADVESQRADVALRLAQTERRFRTITEAMPQIVWSSRPDGRFEFANARWTAYTGAPATPEMWASHIHPDDRDGVGQAWRASIETGEPYEHELRLRAADSSYRWFLCRAVPVRNDQGEIENWIGAGADIHEARLNLEARTVISQELSHRIKNIFSVVTSLIALSARQHPEQAEFAATLRNRISALARAHEFVRPHSPASASRSGQRTFSAFIQDLMGAYIGEGGGIVRFEGEDFTFGDKSATPLALFFHELGTNAAKYGALSAAQGTVIVSAQRRGEDIIIVWKERGGPPIEREPSREGFGTALARISVEGQLDGSIAKTWERDGLKVMVRVPARVLMQGTAADPRAAPEPAIKG